jgi:Fic family protein
MLEVRTKGEEVIKKDIIIENAVRAGLNDRQKNALIYLMEKPNITRAEYVKLNDVSIRTANYDLEVMEKLGFIERIGMGRAIKYMISQGR